MFMPVIARTSQTTQGPSETWASRGQPPWLQRQKAVLAPDSELAPIEVGNQQLETSDHALHSAVWPPAAPSRPFEVSGAAASDRKRDAALGVANHLDREAPLPGEAGCEIRAETGLIHCLPAAPGSTRQGHPHVRARMLRYERHRLGDAPWQIEAIVARDPLVGEASGWGPAPELPNSESASQQISSRALTM